MTEAERRYFQEYVKEVFHYEHQCSTEILARVLLLCELLIEKGLLTDADVIRKLSPLNIATIMNELNYGDDTWIPEEDSNAN
nr:MAG TPA: Nitrile hydratase alpha subunit [Caudoviricetes sp.]